jgi:hypothetical protein
MSKKPTNCEHPYCKFPYCNCKIERLGCAHEPYDTRCPVIERGHLLDWYNPDLDFFDRVHGG